MEGLRGNGIADVSRETLRLILRAAGVSWQATKTWKASNDPEFVEKMNRVLDLYDHPPADGRVVCVDEFGPLNLQPRPGRGWSTTRRPRRLRATYNRPHGVRHMFACPGSGIGSVVLPDPGPQTMDRVPGVPEIVADPRARAATVSGLRQLLGPQAGRGASVVRGQRRRAGVPTTYSSWLNRIECEFAALRYFALNGTDHRSHIEQDTAIGDYSAGATNTPTTPPKLCKKSHYQR
ncbi:hypothetical protein [Nocardia gipuzkoensis]